MVPQVTSTRILIAILIVAVVISLYHTRKQDLRQKQVQVIDDIKKIVENAEKSQVEVMDDIKKVVENGRKSHVSPKYKTFHSENLKRDVPESLLWKIEQADLTMQQINKFFNKNWFLRPSSLPYNLLGQPFDTNFFSQEKQDEWIDNYLKQKTNGIFLEVGAVDGVSLSNTLFFERERNWTGLLIEPNTKFYERLATVHRKAYTINTCLSLDHKISVVNFVSA